MNRYARTAGTNRTAVGTLGPVVTPATDLNANSQLQSFPGPLEDQVLPLEQERTATRAWPTGEALTHSTTV